MIEIKEEHAAGKPNQKKTNLIQQVMKDYQIGSNYFIENLFFIKLKNK